VFNQTKKTGTDLTRKWNWNG